MSILHKIDARNEAAFARQCDSGRRRVLIPALSIGVQHNKSPHLANGLENLQSTERIPFRTIALRWHDREQCDYHDEQAPGEPHRPKTPLSPRPTMMAVSANAK